MNLIILYGIFFLGISYLIYNFVDEMEFFKKFDPEIKNAENCTVLRGAVGIEDLVKYKNIYLLGGSDDRGKLWVIPGNKTNTSNGKLIYVKIRDDIGRSINDIKIYDIKMKDFPKEIAFHPHGIYLYKEKYLYVINHAYNKGGERVEVFEMQDLHDSENGDILQAQHLRSIKYSDDYVGIFNDLIVIGENDEILITKYLPYPDPVTGRSSDLYKTLRYFLIISLKLPWTNIYHCKGNLCMKIPGTESIMNNGITYDEKNKKIYAVNVFEKRVREFLLERLQDSKINLKLLSNIDTIHALDNIEYDKETGIISSGFIGRKFDHFKLEQNLVQKNSLEGVGKRWGGSLTIDTKNKNKVEIQVIQNSLLYGISSSIKDDKRVFHSSWVDDGILICNI